ncbi:MAG: HtaA domain-containing protein [Betaproteobacteria bacterium]|jgi:hypothetical protein
MNLTTLKWGVKESFRQYVDGVGGTISLSEGAERSADGAFIFQAIPGGDLDLSAEHGPKGSVFFKGAVSFNAHGGMLKSTLSELAVEAGPEGLVLTVLEGPMNQSRCAIANLTLVNEPGISTTKLRAEITLDGMYQIADNYPPGTALDNLELS